MLLSNSKYPVNNAINSSLEWDGLPPKQVTDNITSFPFDIEEGKIIDVIPSSVGDLAVVWKTDATSSNLSYTLGDGYGMKKIGFYSMDTGDIQGYIKIAFMNNETIARSFGDDEFTAFRWKEKYSEHDYGLGKQEFYDNTILKGEKLLEKRREIWVNIHKYGKHFYNTNDEDIACENISLKHVPDDEQVKKDLEKESQKIWDEEISCLFHYNKDPYIEFSSVYIQNQGLGASLYIFAARMIAKEQNKSLRASIYQSKDAKKLWGKFKQHMPNRIKTQLLTYEKNTIECLLLDFRD